MSARENSFDWNDFIFEVSALKDPIIESIFCQATFNGFKHFPDSPELKEVVHVFVSFDRKLKFFEDVFIAAKRQWIVCLNKIFGSSSELIFDFSLIGQEKPKELKVLSSDHVNIVNVDTHITKKVAGKNVNELNVSDKEKWKLANKLISEFPGKLYLVDRG